MAQSYKPGRQLVKRAVALMLLTSLSGCIRGDPWSPLGLQAPEPLEARSWFGIFLGEHQLGVEERLRGAGERVRRRHYRFLVRGAPVELRAGNREPETQALATEEGPLVFQPLSGPLFGPLVDLPEILRIPHPALPRARASHHARIRVRGDVPGATSGLVVLDHPLPAELLERPLIQQAVRQTRDSLRVHPSPGTPDALLALQSGQGDCNEHAVLFVALAQQLGLEARTAAGVVYEDAGMGPGFYPHAWAEVRTATHGWVPVDPVWGQIVADATHLPLGMGVFDGAILTRLADLDIEVEQLR